VRVQRRSAQIGSTGAGALAVVSALLVGATLACAPSGNGSGAGPTGPVDANRLYQRQCATCHGAYGRGDGPSAGMSRAANLTDPEFHARSTPESIADVIRNGRGLMPPWSHLSDAEIDGLVVFVQSLGPPTEDEGSGSDENPVLTVE
jgi:mono/diheme cytochrome c family protein